MRSPRAARSGAIGAPVASGRLPARPGALIVAAVVTLLLGGCGEPPLAVEIPPRDGHIADMAGILDVEALEGRLEDYAADDGVDIVALTYIAEDANAGEAFRAGRAFVDAWDADVALVAVAAPGAFTDPQQEAFVGLQPLDDFAVGRGTREEITEQLWPELILERRWDEVFTVGAEELRDALVEDGQ